MFIYKITNTVNNKLYIGKTCKTIERRWWEHCNEAKNNDSGLLHRAIRKYGKDNFLVEQIDTAITDDELAEKEIFWINSLNSNAKTGWGYNVAPGGYGGNQIKYLPEEEIIKRRLMSVLRAVIRKLKRKENNLSPEEFRQTRIEAGRKAAMARAGSKFMTDGNAEKFILPKDFDSYLNNGWKFGRKPRSEEWNNKIGLKNKGRKHSDEFKAKMSEISKNRKYSEETCKKKSESMKGKNAGKMYIHNSEGVVKFIRPDQLESYLNLGWKKGMK